LLFGQKGAEAEQAAERLAGQLATRAEAPSPVIARTALSRVSQLLNIEVADVVVGAWRTRSALLKAAHETVAQPGLQRQVVIKSFSFPWDYEMDTEVTFNQAAIATLTFVLAFEAELTAVSAIVKAGRIIRLEGGAGVAWGTLKLRVSPAEVPL